MTKPDFTNETTEPKHLASPNDWYCQQVADAMDDGYGWHKYTVDKIDAPPTHLLFEAWKVRPTD